MKSPSVAEPYLSVLFLSFALAAIFIGVGNTAHAEFFGIGYDNTCKTLIKNNISSNCPTYEDIITLFPDTSNQDASGKFAYYNGIYQRTPAKLFDSFEYYRFWPGSVLFIDPPDQTKSRIKFIEIKANLKEYKLPGSLSYNKEDHSIITGTGRYIDSCRLAYVDASNWIFLVGDTLNHMNNNCSPDSTKFNSTIITKLGKVQHDIRDSYKYKLEQFQKAAIEQCGKKVCLYETEQPTPP